MSQVIQPEQAREFALWVVRKLRQAGFEALWAGGCVRDQLLGLEPSDYDVATSARPEQVRHCFGRSRTLTMGAAFGVVTVVGRPGQGQIEIATFRWESGYSDGRHPDQVCFSTAQEDAQRRDFTMNGLFYDPLTDKVIDYVGGCEDLRAGIVRAIGNPYERIGEDRLRMLRAVRFATTFHFELESATAAAVRSEARHVTQVSAERIAAEMRKMLLHARRDRAVGLLRDLDLLPVILPEVSFLAETSSCSSGEHDAADWETTLEVLGGLREPTFRVALAGLLWEIHRRAPKEYPLVDSVCDRWKLSNRERQGVDWMLTQLPTICAAPGGPWPRLQRVLISSLADELLTLAEPVCMQVNGSRDAVDYCQRQRELPESQWNPAPLITGDDLRRSGFPPSPLYGQVLDAVRDAQLEGRVTTREAALTMAHTMLRSAERSE